MLGFRIIGSPFGRRKLVDADKALAGYAACDSNAEVNKEGFLSAFTFTDEFRLHVETTGSTADYHGPCGARFLHWDIDRDDLEAALRDARCLATIIRDRYGEPLIYYSGSKGFHVDLAVDFEPSLIFNRVAKAFALAVAGGITVDEGVYDKVRLFRAPNSKHPKSGLHKVRLSWDELQLDLPGIQAIAAQPRPFMLPAQSIAEQARLDWLAATAEVERQAEVEQTWQGNAHLNRATLDFIRDGAIAGDRHRLLFSAAANLAEFNCPPALAEALLTPAGLDCGLKPSDVKRQIQCGLTWRKA